MSRSRSWRRVGVQLGALTGFGLALVQGIEPSRAAPVCVVEGQCTFTKPLLLIAVDYSTAMNAMFDVDTTRWEAAVAAVQGLVDTDNGWVQGNTHVALMRFGHDPEPEQPGTSIAGDASGLVDGQRLDVGWYDPLAPDKDYFNCNGEAIKAALAATPPPLEGAPAGIGAWTAGAVARAGGLIAQAAADHPEDLPWRKAGLILITQGVWSDATGAQVMQPPADDPAPVVSNMFQNAGVPTFVLSLGDAEGLAEANELAAAGGTNQAAVEAAELIDAVKLAVQALINDVEPPQCAPGFPRVMFILDASSSMLNVMGDSVHGAMGETRWDLLRTEGLGLALGQPSPALFGGGFPVETWMFAGAAVFGGDAPAEQKLLFDYGPCHGNALEWALDPATSCAAPGCTDPWGGPPITWTFASTELAWTHAPVTSHVPRCEVDPQKPGACAGSGAFVHLGLELAQSNQAAYRAACLAPNASDHCVPGTKFYNVLIVDGPHDSDDAQVEAPLEEMFAAGVRTYVIGLGELAADPVAVEQLTNMAAWGSGGQLDFFAADTQVELQAALAEVFGQIFTEVFAELMFDPCCAGLNCQGLAVDEPDPVPGRETDSEGTSGGETETTSTAGGPTTGGEVPTSGGESGEPPLTTGSPGTSAGPTGGDPPDDTDSDGETGSQDGSAKEGCGCATTGGPQGLVGTLASLGLAALGRRRRRSS